MNSQTPANPTPNQPAPVHRYVAVGLGVMSGAQHIATAVTASTAKRIAAALNFYRAHQTKKGW